MLNITIRLAYDYTKIYSTNISLTIPTILITKHYPSLANQVQQVIVCSTSFWCAVYN